MPEVPEYVSQDRRVEVTVQQPDGSKETFNTRYDYITFIDVRDDGVWVRDENDNNRFYPSDRVLEMVLPSSDSSIPEHLQKQRRL